MQNISQICSAVLDDMRSEQTDRHRQTDRQTDTHKHTNSKLNIALLPLGDNNQTSLTDTTA